MRLHESKVKEMESKNSKQQKCSMVLCFYSSRAEDGVMASDE